MQTPAEVKFKAFKAVPEHPAVDCVSLSYAQQLWDEKERLRAQLKQEQELNWTASLCDRVNELIREHPKAGHEVKDGPECSRAIQVIHGYCGSLKSERDSYKQQAELYAKDIQNVMAQRDELRKKVEEAKRQLPDPIRDHFGACLNCKPIMCCGGQECGCMGLPVDFSITEQCDENGCFNKVWTQRKELKHQLTQLSSSEARLREAVLEFIRHAMYPFPDCSDEKKLAFIAASDKLNSILSAPSPKAITGQ